MHEIIGVVITIATILAATFFSHQSANNIRSELRADINSLRGELHSEISGLRSEVRSEISGLRSELHSEIGGLRGEMLSIRNELLGKLDSIQKDQRDLYAEQARQDLRITNLEQQKN